jgi:hypothetical protein
VLLQSRAGEASRHVRELVELAPPDTFELQGYFDAVMAGSALRADRGGLAEGLAEVRRRTDEAARKSLEYKGPRDTAPPPTPGASGPSSPGPSAPPGGGGGGAPKSRAGGSAVTGADDFWLGKGGARDRSDAARERAERGVELRALEAQDDARRIDDLARRSLQRAFFRALPDTAELAERDYWRVRIADDDSDLIQPSPFWLDFAESRANVPFVSAHFPLATRNTSEMLLALALLDLPFEAEAHTTEDSGTSIVFKAGSRLLMARESLVEVDGVERSNPRHGRPPRPCRVPRAWSGSWH